MGGFGQVGVAVIARAGVKVLTAAVIVSNSLKQFLKIKPNVLGTMLPKVRSNGNTTVRTRTCPVGYFNSLRTLYK